MEAHVLSLNNFNMPRVYRDTEAMYRNIVYLILLEKGKFLSHPDMGVGLRSRYRFNSQDGVLQTLKNDITDQINTYLPDLNVIGIDLALNDHVLTITINSTDGLYLITYDQKNDSVDIGNRTFTLANL